MQRKFEKLLQQDFKERAELEQEFLQKTIDALSSRNQGSALEVAAQFDRFKKQATDEKEEFYSDFFEVLGKLIKQKYLDRDEDFSATNLDEYS